MAAEGNKEGKKEDISVRMFDSNSTDQVTRERGICLEKDCSVRKYFMELKECTKRVKSKSYTTETCHQETCDLMEALDRCMKDKAFVKIM